MSLKAKIEAVIYASEEPVTLAQLTGLLGEEAQAELDAIAAQQHSLALEDEGAALADDGTQGEATEDAADAAAGAPEPILDADALNAETLGADDTSATRPPSDAPLAGAATSEAEPASEASGLPSEASTAEPTAKALAADQKLAARKLRDYFRSLLDELIADYANGNRGLEIREVAGGFRLATKPEYHDAVRGFVKSLKPPLKLTLQALETLAVVAYKQPVTAPEVSEIRGVDSAGVLGSLLTRKLVTTAGRKQVIGRPILYKTTKDFLLRFGLKDINELPSIEEFEKMAGELNDAVQEEIPMEHPETSGEQRTDQSDDERSELSAEEPTDQPGEEAIGDQGDSDPAELEGHNLRPVEHHIEEPDAPTSEPDSISSTGEEPSPESAG